MVSWDKFPSILPVLLSVDSFLRTHYIHKHDKITASHPTQIVESVELANGKIQMCQIESASIKSHSFDHFLVSGHQVCVVHESFSWGIGLRRI